MSAEQTLLPHWKACASTRDPVCISSFADHLMELWDTAVRDDAEFYAETGAVTPVLRLIADEWQFNMDHSDVDGRVRLDLFRRQAMKSTKRVAHLPSPSGWDYYHHRLFVSVLTEFFGDPPPSVSVQE